MIILKKYRALALLFHLGTRVEIVDSLMLT